MSDTTAFSRFFREATVAERRAVFEQVIEEVCRKQMQKAYEFARLVRTGMGNGISKGTTDC